MRPVLNKLLRLLLVGVVSVTLTACTASETYRVRDYLFDLSKMAGIYFGSDNAEMLSALEDWQIYQQADGKKLSDPLDYDYLGLTISRMLNSEEEGLAALIEEGWLPYHTKPSEHVDKDKARAYISRIVNEWNDRQFAETYSGSLKADIKEVNRYYLVDNQLYTAMQLEAGDVVYLENDDRYVVISEAGAGYYSYQEAAIEDVYEELHFAGSQPLDLSEAIDIPYGEVIDNEPELSKVSQLAARRTNALRKSFSTEGYKIAYSISTSAISVRLTKEIDEQSSAYFDFTISDIKPSYNYEYVDGQLENAFFKVDFKTVDELGMSNGHYLKYIADLQELNDKDFLSGLKALVKKNSKDIEATVRICQIKTPLPNVPTAYLNMDLLARIYVSGKVELLVNNSYELGFEKKGKAFRLVGNAERDVDGIIAANSKAVLGLNFNIEAAGSRLLDIEADAGLQAQVATTLHCFDDRGKLKSEQSALPYDGLHELSQANSAVAVCGDLSFNYVLDVTFNTASTALAKLGFTRKQSFLNKNDQVFKNLTHIENNSFVRYCTRKNRMNDQVLTGELKTDKLTLYKYAVVLGKGESYLVEISSLPSGYQLSDLCLKAYKPEIVGVDGLLLSGKAMGNSRVAVETSDGLYRAEINVLVSDADQG